MSNASPIGVLDSGIGGLSVFLEIKKLLPKESIVYAADSKNVPYSEKSENEILELSKKLVGFLTRQRAKAVVVACNTITVSAIKNLRKEFPQIPIIGTVPVIKTAASLTKTGRIGIFSTKKTAKSQYQKNLIEQFAKDLTVVNLGSDKIAPLIEEGKITGAFNNMLKAELEPFKNETIDVLVLGCTHYPLVKDKIQTIMGPRVSVIDSGAAIARQVKRILEQNSILSEESKAVYTFYTTGNVEILANHLERLQLVGLVKQL